MPTDPPLPDPLALLAADRFLRGLARSLLRDAEAADDVVQDAWLAAMARPPRAAGALRAWLRTVVHNLVSNRRAAGAARARREQAAARPESVPSDDEVRAREALRREVVEHVLALPEPYRAAVLLRWFEDLPPRAIAARLGVPSTTVRTRLARALDMLRARMDATRHGDRRTWCLALIPLARPQLTGAAAVVGGGAVLVGSVVMHKWFVGVLVAMLLLCGAGIVFVLGVGGAPGGATTQAALVSATGSLAPDAPPADEGRSLRRAEIPSELAVFMLPQRAGRLLLADGRAAVDVPWWFEPGRRLPPREGFLEQRGPHALRRTHPAPADAERTGADGGFPLPHGGRRGPTIGALWCEPTHGVRVGFWLELSGAPAEALVLRLPELADLAVTCAGIGPQDRWGLLAFPAMQEADGEWNFGQHLVRLLDPTAGGAAGGRTALELDAHVLRRLVGPGPAVVRVPAGVPYHASVEAEACAVRTPGAVHRAPAQVRFEAGAPLFTLPVEVNESDGRTPTSAGGLVIVSPRGETSSTERPLVDGRATVGWCEWPGGTSCDLRVRMADGELFRDAFTVGEPTAQPVRRFVRGRGEPPQRVQFPAGTQPLAGATVVVQTRDGRLVRPEREFSWLPGQPGGLVVIGPQELGLFAFARDWRRLWAILPDGQVGQADHDDREPTQGAWLATEPLGEFDLRAEFRARHAREVIAGFELEVSTSSGARSWQRVESLQLFAEDEDVAIPLWRKCVPTGWRGRVRLVSWSGEFDDVLIPRR